MIRLLQQQSKTIAGAAIIVGVFSFLSRIIGLIRDRILAGEFGASDTLDVYYAAFKIPDLFFSLIVIGALSASFIPLFSNHYQKQGEKKAWEFTNNTLHLLGLGMFVLSLVLFVFAKPLAGLVAPGFSPELLSETASFLRVMLVAEWLLTFSLVFGSVLQSLKHFLLYSLAPIFYNLGIIVGAVWLVDWFGPIGLAWGVVIGATLHTVVQWLGVHALGYRYAFRLRWTADTQQMLWLTGPRMLGIAISQFMLIALAMIASLLYEGSVTIFQFAYNIQFFAVGVIGVSFAIAAFPSLTESIAADDVPAFRHVFSSTVRQLLFFLIPIMLVFLILRAQIVRVVVGAGEFDWTATILTADTLAFFALTFIPQSLVFLLSRAFFALHDTVTPLTAGIVGSLVGILSALLFTKTFGVIGLGMAYSLAAIVNAMLLWMPLRQRIGSLDELRILQTLWKMIAAALVAAVVMQSMKPFVVRVISLDTFLGVLSQGLIAGGFGLVVYALLSHLLKIEEWQMFVLGIQKRWFKTVEAQETVSSVD